MSRREVERDGVGMGIIFLKKNIFLWSFFGMLFCLYNNLGNVRIAWNTYPYVYPFCALCQLSGVHLSGNVSVHEPSAEIPLP